jgi:predicted enzyme related to lactoylglutathione lyase
MMIKTLNSITHQELPSTDFAKSAAFYSGVFGWKCEEIPGMNYMIYSVENGLGGGFNKVDSIVSGHGHMSYISVEDIHATLAKVEQARGRTVMPKTGLPNNWGFIAQFADPCGVVCGLWSQS